VASVAPEAGASQGPGFAIALLSATRLRTLPLALAPVFVGTGVAIHEGGFRAVPASAALAVALLLQIATNFANDLFDFEKGADDETRLGPPRATQQGWLSQGQMRAAIAVTLAAALVPGLYLVWLGGWPLFLLGVLCLVAALTYTGGPWPYGYHGLGDLAVLFFFGFVSVAGTVYVQTGAVSALALFAAFPVGALATAVLAVNNLRDRESDERAGKRTLAVIAGARAVRVEYSALLALAYLVPVGLALGSGDGEPKLALPLLTLPLAGWLVRELARRDGAELNPLLGRTAQTALFYSLLFAAGLALA